MARNERLHYLRMVGVEVFRDKQGKKEGGAAEAQEGGEAEAQVGDAIKETETGQEEGQEDEGMRKENSDMEQNGSSGSKSNGAEEVSST